MVISREDQRARLIPRTWNLLGHPEGVSGDELIGRAQEHAAKYGAELVNGEVASVEGQEGSFHVRLTDGREFRGCHIIFATGVQDIPPAIPGVEKYVGRGLRHCPVCDGYEATGQRLAIFGTGDEVARHALYLTNFTDAITILLNGEGQWTNIDPDLRDTLESKGIRAVEGRVLEVLDQGAEIRGFRIEDGALVEVDRAYSALGLRPHSELAWRMGVELNESGFIKVGPRGRTNLEGVYAVGDVVNAGYAQIAIAIGQAATAAIHLHARNMAGD